MFDFALANLILDDFNFVKLILVKQFKSKVIYYYCFYMKNDFNKINIKHCDKCSNATTKARECCFRLKSILDLNS